MSGKLLFYAIDKYTDHRKNTSASLSVVMSARQYIINIQQHTLFSRPMQMLEENQKQR